MTRRKFLCKRKNRLSGGLLEVAGERGKEKVLVGNVDGHMLASGLPETYVIRSFLSLGFFRPPKAILVPGMYFLGFSR